MPFSLCRITGAHTIQPPNAGLLPSPGIEPTSIRNPATSSSCCLRNLFNLYTRHKRLSKYLFYFQPIIMTYVYLLHGPNISFLQLPSLWKTCTKYNSLFFPVNISVSKFILLMKLNLWASLQHCLKNILAFHFHKKTDLQTFKLQVESWLEHKKISSIERWNF